MLKTDRAVTTDGGIKLQIRNLSGAEIEITRLVTGDGVYTADEMSAENLQKKQALKSQKQSFGISSVDNVGDESVVASALITNADLKEGYTIREVGLYAREKGKPDTECLYSISIASVEDYIPPYSGGAESRILERYYLSVSDSDTVFLSYVQDPVALVEDVDRKDSELEDKIIKNNVYVRTIVSEVQYDLAEVIFQLSVKDMTENSMFKNVIVDKIDSDSAVNLISGSYASGKVYI